MRRWLVFGNHVLFKSTVPARERELIILRIGWLCEAEYEWAQHYGLANNPASPMMRCTVLRSAPLPKGGTSVTRFSSKRPTSYIKTRVFSDATWQGLSKHYNTQQLMDIVFAVGQYNLVSMALNTLGVQLDPG